MENNKKLTIEEEAIIAAKNYIGLPLEKDMDEDERYFNARNKEYDAFLAGVEYERNRLKSTNNLELPVMGINNTEYLEHLVEKSKALGKTIIIVGTDTIPNMNTKTAEVIKEIEYQAQKTIDELKFNEIVEFNSSKANKVTPRQQKNFERHNKFGKRKK